MATVGVLHEASQQELSKMKIRSCSTSIMIVRTNDESLKLKSLRHSCQKRGQSKVSVAFATVEIQEYPITLGDNPSVSSGPPLTVSWVPSEKTMYSVEKYEGLRESKRRRSGSQLILKPSERWLRLLRVGINPVKIDERAELVAKERERRLKSLTMMSFITFDLQARMEMIRRGVKNVIMRRRKESQRQWLQKALEMDRDAFKQRSAALLYECEDQKKNEMFNCNVDIKKVNDHLTCPLMQMTNVGLSTLQVEATGDNATPISMSGSLPRTR
eukprot:CAMPEP_0185735972 /NCGR_PEP_ID=MMETSP1171-20130828/26579_1 /TAXON_ID=374046 /ORGANISM="Helicotheca tamensis, Strain CCMP826" /LENGTH=271 /DNA_ID=CAMNT_0028406439 /DNA_START=72 /DNA_END=887 /DNA_ORIENTATION=+